jgi:5-methylcytosine-specific restriction endonuclease McrA
MPRIKGVKILGKATVICIDCGIIIKETTTYRKRCVECKRKVTNSRTKKFKKDHVEETRKANNEYWKRIRAECPERAEDLNNRFKKWYNENREYCLDQARKYRQEHPECKDKNLKYQKEHPELKRMSENHRRALKHNAEGRHTKVEFYSLCESKEWKCSYCGKSLTKRTVSEDHIIPLSKGGSDNIDNIAPCCRFCNIRKHARSLEEFFEYLKRIGSSVDVGVWTEFKCKESA